MSFCIPHSLSSRFTAIVRGYAQDEGLPFAAVLTEAQIQCAADEEGVAFGAGPNAVYTPAVTLWGFVGQVLAGHKSCVAAVARIIVLLTAMGRPPCSAATGAYCKARAKLPEKFLRRLTYQVGAELEDQAPAHWRWHPGAPGPCAAGRRHRHHFARHGGQPKSLSATEVATARTRFPHDPSGRAAHLRDGCAGRRRLRSVRRQRNRRERVVASVVRATAPRRRRGSRPLSLLVLRDRAVAAAWRRCGVSLAASAEVRFSAGPTPGPVRSRRRMAATGTAQVDGRSHLRHHPRNVDRARTAFQRRQSGQPHPRDRRGDDPGAPGLDDNAYSKDDIADLYHQRWHAELDLRSIKQTLGMDMLACKTPALARKELWAYLLGYNLARKVAAQAAWAHGLRPRQISFAGTVQTLEAFAPALLAAEPERWQQVCHNLFTASAAHRVGDRPGRVEPRRLKRRCDKYPMLHRPRAEARAELLDGVE